MSGDALPGKDLHTALPIGDEVGFDERLERLEGIVRALEEGGLPLEQSIERYREGVALLAGCRALPERSRGQVEGLGQIAETGPDVLT